MKKRIVWITTTVMMALLAWVPGAGRTFADCEPTPETYRIHFAGKGANAAWTTCPSGPAPNEECTVTYITLAEEMYRRDGTRFPSKGLALYQFHYMADDQGNLIALFEAGGMGEVRPTFGTKLISASASAMVPLTICTFVDEAGNCTYSDGGLVAVSASWTGVGELIKWRENDHSTSKEMTCHWHWKGSSREATASAQVNGTDLENLLYADLHDAKTGDFCIEHGGH